MSDKVRVYEIAEEAGASSQDVIAKAKDLGIELKSPQSAVSFEEAEEIANYLMTGKSSKISEKSTSKPKKVKKDEVEVKVEEPKIEIKEEIVEKKEQEIRKKPELKKVVISKPVSKAPAKTQDEEEKPDLNIDNSNKIVPKRRGLVIIKKKKPKEELEIEQNLDLENQAKKQMKSLSEILGGSEEEQKNNDYTSPAFNNDDSKKFKPKKEKKKIAVKAQDHGVKLEVQREYTDDFVSSDDSLLGEEVVLLDMDLEDTYKIFDEPKPQNPAKQSRSSRPAAFGNVPQGLKRAKRKKLLKLLKLQFLKT